MDKKFDFDTQEERDAIIDREQIKGFRLLEEQYHSDGKHLIFTDEPPKAKSPPPRNLAQELDDLIAILKSKGIIL